MADSQDKGSERVTLWALVGSVFAAAFGVQSRRNRERDFSKGNIFVFIVAGVVFTALFVGAVLAVVYMVLPKGAAG